MKVSYPMYELPEMQVSLGKWWSAICQRLEQQGINAPESLSDPEGDLFEYWLRPDLLLSQTCGFPLVSQLKSNVKLIGSPVFSSPGCDGPNYCSYYIVHKNDSRTTLKDYQGARFTYNGTDSQSGFNAVRVNLIEQGLPIPYFGENLLSGGHRNSILNVGKGAAEICAVDCVTHSLLQMHQPYVLKNTRILAQTKLTPGLPFITSINTDDDVIGELFNAIKETCLDKSMQGINRDLQIKDIEKVSLDSYCSAISQPESQIGRL